MDIAYLISAHTDAPQLKRLISALHKGAHFFIHIDKKSDISQFTNIISSDNVHFLPDSKRVDVRWGTILEVDYQMELIKEAINYPLHFDRIFFISGMDYPLWSNDKITKWLEEQGDKEIIKGICMSQGGINEVQKRLYRTPRPFVNIPFLSNDKNTKLSILLREFYKKIGKYKHLKVDGTHLALYKGGAWWCITEGLAKYIVNKYETIPEIKKYFRDSFGPAETLIQTIVFNSRTYRDRCLLRQGEYPGLAALTPLHYINYDPVIKIMDETDFDTLMRSGKMFTRKVVSGTSDKLVEMIDNERK